MRTPIEGFKPSRRDRPNPSPSAIRRRERARRRLVAEKGLAPATLSTSAKPALTEQQRATIAEAKIISARLRQPCRFRLELITPCPTCSGGKARDIHVCQLYGKCTVGPGPWKGRDPQMKACAGCDDYVLPPVPG